MANFNDKLTLLEDNRGNLISQLNHDFYIHWKNTDRVEFKELKDVENETPVVRAFSINSDGLSIQMRAHQSLTRNSVKKNLLATAFISKRDLEFLLEQINKH